LQIVRVWSVVHAQPGTVYNVVSVVDAGADWARSFGIVIGIYDLPLRFTIWSYG
jgi:hypothetical protein